MITPWDYVPMAERPIHQLISSDLADRFVERTTIFSSRRRMASLETAPLFLMTEEMGESGISHFVAGYIYMKEGLSVSAKGQIELINNLLAIIEKKRRGKTMPVLFIKLVIQIFSQNSSSISGRPTIPETVQQYIRGIQYKPNPDLRVEVIAIYSARIACEILKGDFSPGYINDVKISESRDMFDGRDAMAILDMLVKSNILIEGISATGREIKFKLDPIAEYLAASHWCALMGSDQKAWADHLHQLESAMKQSKTGFGYCEALSETILCKKDHDKIPDFVSVKLDELYNLVDSK